jgi:hypothetical protein
VLNKSLLQSLNLTVNRFFRKFFEISSELDLSLRNIWLYESDAKDELGCNNSKYIVFISHIIRPIDSWMG